MQVYLDHGIETEKLACTCYLSDPFAHFTHGESHKETVDRLVETLRDAQALLQMSHTLFGSMRDNLEGRQEPGTISKMVDLTYSAQRIIDGYEERIVRAVLGD